MLKNFRFTLDDKSFPRPVTLAVSLALLLLPVFGCGPSVSDKDIENMTYRIKRLETRVAALELNNDALNELDKKVKRITEENERRQTALTLQISKLERQVQTAQQRMTTKTVPRKVEPITLRPTTTDQKTDKKSEEIAVRETAEPVRYHQVRKGDTLYSISKQYDLKPETLKKLNNLDSNTIKPGQQLRVQ